MKIVARTLLGLFAVLLVAMAGLIHMSWAPDLPVEQLKARWAPEPSQFIALDGMSVHIRDQGPRDDPSPILLLHGTSASLHTWEGWAKALEAERRVISVDMPGFGLTGPFPDGDYRIEHYVTFVTALLDQLGVQQVVLAGNSLGGQIAWETALAKPLRVNGLILVDSAGLPLQSTSVPIGFKLAKIPLLAPLMTNLLPRSMIEASVQSVYGNPALVTDELVERYYQLTLREGNRAALGQRFRQNSDLSGNMARLTQLNVPTLIIWGGRDGLTPLAYAAFFKQSIKGSQLVVLEGLGHVPQEEDPQATVALVKDFLATLPR